jgi:hypothetical protein
VAQALNRRDGSSFDERDQERFRELMDSVGVILESWRQMSARARSTKEAG